MSGIGGSIESVSLDGRNFSVAADAESNRKLGGFSNETAANGDGTARMVKTREAWSIGGLSVEVDDLRGDPEYLQSLADRPDFYPVAITYASGATYQGVGQIVDGIEVSSKDAVAELGLSGPGVLSRQ